MHSKETFDLYFLARKGGMGVREAAGLVGVPVGSRRHWEAGRVPRAYGWAAGDPANIGAARRARRARPTAPEVPLDESERAAYDAAMEENVLLKAVLDDLKAAGSAPGGNSRRRCVELGERLRRETGPPLTRMLAFLGLPKSSYEYHRARLGADRYAPLRPVVREVFEALGGSRGYRPVWAELRRRGTRVSEKVVRRVMREEGLVARGRRRRRAWSSYAGEASPAPANLPLMPDGTHRFRAGRPNELWVTDITEFRLPSGAKCYLSPVVGCFDGRPVAWSIGARPTAALANSSLELACATLSVGEAPVVHSDRGGHYRWPGWRAICERHGLTRSMSRKGTSGDNARAEGFFGLLKCEFFHGRDWRGWSLGDFMAALDGWLRWFREGRISQALGWLTPDEHRLALGYAV